MEVGSIGSLSVTVVGIGCNNFGSRIDAARSIEVVASALDAGINFFDTADMYGNGLSEEQLRDANAASASRPGSARFVSVQNEYSLLHREPEEGVLGECERLDIAFLPFFPLKSGLLTGKYRKGQPIPSRTRVANFDRYRSLLTDENLGRVEGLIAYASEHNRTLLELAVSWLLARRPVASVIAGATSASQVQANASAAGWRLSGSDLEEIEDVLRRAA